MLPGSNEPTGKLYRVQFGIQLKAYADSVDRRLAESLPSLADVPRELHAAMRYSCLAPGKRLRPALCLACADAVGGGCAATLDAACAIEMVHCFSLIHDDLPAIDNDNLRRGQPTCHIEFGEAVAILAGDALFALAYQTLCELDAPPDRVVAATRALSLATGSHGLVGGETLDVLAEGQDVDAETVETIHRRKTGALIAASCEIGALLGGADEVAANRLREYGTHLGMAFQIADDILNEVGSADQLGKPVGSDQARGKATFPAVLGLDPARKRAGDEVSRALDCLEPGQDFLRALAEYAISRMN